MRNKLWGLWCVIWREAEIKHGRKKNRCASFGAKRKLNTEEKKIGVYHLAPSGNKHGRKKTKKSVPYIQPNFHPPHNVISPLGILQKLTIFAMRNKLWGLWCVIWRQAEIKHRRKKNRCASSGAKRKLNTEEKKSVCVIWRQAEIKHRSKKNRCLIWRQPEIKHGRKKNRC